jgi:trehalose 6-phosphate phosphatase
LADVIGYQSGAMAQLLQRTPPPSLASLDCTKPVALFLDFDGTLVDLAPTPNSIALRPDLIEQILALSHRLEDRLALISGRSIDDLHSHLGALPVVMAGSHGADIECSKGMPIGKPPLGIADEVLNQLRLFSAKMGIDLEEKTHGAALHFRAAPDLEPVAHAFADDLAQCHNLDAKRGKCVVELVEKGANKGCAVEQIMVEVPFRGAVPWFVGDDVTDEDGFAACIKLGGEAVLVGERENSCARHALPNVAAVHHWLEFE